MSTYLPIAEAAAVVGVSTATVRQWVRRGYVEPIRRGARPMMFDELAIARCAADRMSRTMHARLDTLWAVVLDIEANCHDPRARTSAP